MIETDKHALLAEFARSGSETAFARLVAGHVNLVFSTARRFTDNAHDAEEITQAVFILLARKAANFPPAAVLSGWLYETTRLTAANFQKREFRRQRREQEATMQSHANEPDQNAWAQVAPLLDEAMGSLGEADRAAVVLRYFENQPVAAVAATLQTSEAAAYKRVERAVEKLRHWFSHRGVTLTAAFLASAVAANAVQAAPISLAAKITAASVASGAATSLAPTSSATWFGFHKAMVTALAVMLAGAALLLATHPRPVHPVTANSATLPPEIPPAIAAGTPAAATTNTPAATDPDPVQLLHGILRARLKIHSGTVELRHVREGYEHGHKNTTESRMTALFDGRKLRFEATGQEFAYAYAEDENKQNDIRGRADSLGHEAAVQAGLMEAKQIHTLDIYNDGLFYCYRDEGHTYGITSIATNRSWALMFDPRDIGLSDYWELDAASEVLAANDKILADKLKTELVGAENLEGVPVWHVRIKTDFEPFDYWIDQEHPARLLQMTIGLNLIKSRYSETDLNDPLPVEITNLEFQNGALAYTIRMTCIWKDRNQVVDPELFTLAGMGMPIGTQVNDNRKHIILGYWTGSGLTENLPRRGDSDLPAAPKLGELLAVLDSAPASPEGGQCAIWVMLNTPDGPAVEKAAAVIRQFHTQDTNLLAFCRELDRARPRSTRDLLEDILRDNPVEEIRGNACFTLATLAKDEAKYGENQEATARAIRLYNRIIKEFGRATLRGYPLPQLARPELDELQHLIIGQPAPEAAGVDLNGQQLDLKNYRGQVTVVAFWMGVCVDIYPLQKLRTTLAGTPFALVGVNCDDDTTRKPEFYDRVDWPSFRDGRNGPIAARWHNHSWPDYWVLDRKGIIRYRDLRAYDLAKAVNQLLEE